MIYEVGLTALRVMGGAVFSALYSSCGVKSSLSLSSKGEEVNILLDLSNYYDRYWSCDVLTLSFAL